MGRSEWGIRVTSNADIEHVQGVVAAHNALATSAAELPEIKYDGGGGDDDDGAYASQPRYEVGEELGIYALLRYHGGIWLCIGNGGGAEETSCFLKKHLSSRMTGDMLCPHAKPPGWYTCTDYVWQAENRDDAIPLASLQSSCFAAAAVAVVAPHPMSVLLSGKEEAVVVPQVSK